MTNSMSFFLGLILLLPAALFAQTPKQNIIANPLNLNYRYQLDLPSRREAGEPVCEYFKGKYYLFASKSGGYWSSPDLKAWTYIPCTTISTIENYAPTILVLGDTLYYLIGGSPRIFYTTNPDEDNWKELNSKFIYGTGDPAFFKDEDTGKVYLYWGCSDVDPIVGVEVDPADGFRAIGVPKPLIEHHDDLYGWEVSGSNNTEYGKGWNEGPSMIKHKGKYYLQYASPATHHRIYGDGAYVSDNPLGPFTCMENNPFCIKPGGFIGAAGHGHTFQDVYGNWWHLASMKISVRHGNERRMGIFPVYFSEDDRMFSHTVWTDYPFAIPDEKADFQTDNRSMNWNLISYKKPVRVSSTLTGHPAASATDEKIESWWAARTGDAGEWLQVDLQSPMIVRAIHVNFTDEGFPVVANPFSYVYYQYKIEKSDDGNNWTMLVDKTQNTVDAPHELLVLDEAITTRYLRITNTKALDGKFSISGFRVFGNGSGNAPEEVPGLSVERNSADHRRYQLRWNNIANATGYVVHWGVNPQQLNNAVMVYTNQLEAGYFNRDSEYFFSVDAFNENGVTIGKTIAKDNTSNLKNPKKAAISVFSNPSGGVYHVQLPEAGIVSLSNINGQSLFSAHYQQTDITIDISGYPKGVYILSCRSGNQNDKIKLIKN